jgi:actin-related protein 6
VTPLYKGRPIQQAIRRFDVGGKFLTNYLKELVSIRHYNMTDETHLMNEIKEAACYVSKDFAHDLEVTRKGARAHPKKTAADGRDIVVDYVLPDYNAHQHGFMRPHDPSLATKIKKIGAMANPGGIVEDFMTLGNERFSVPELLFNPGDVGMKQAGLPETVLQSLSSLPSGLWPVMLANIIVVGGTAKFDGFAERLYVGKVPHVVLCRANATRETEIRQLAPSECTVRVAKCPEWVEYSMHVW